MCGIVGYIGERDAYPVLIKGLQRLEYRGYDSAGVALFNGDLHVYKKEGKVKELEDFVTSKDKKGSLGIGHTRWATHGEPNDTNAHPHLSMSGSIALIHNGIIENYALLKENLKSKGYEFHSETDTEVLVNWIEEIQKQTKTPIEEAVRIALAKVVGAYAIAVIDKKDPSKLIAARKGSPLVVGIGEKEFFIGSDATPIIEYTKNVIYLKDEEIATLSLDHDIKVITIDNELQTPEIQQLDLEIELLEKGDFEHYMLKEIYEQPKTISDCLRGRLNASGGKITLSSVNDYQNRLTRADRLIIVACGTSWHSALIGEYLFEELARIPVEVEYASEFRYRDPIINKEDVIIALSQSGETADTLAALELANQHGPLTYGICNVVGSSIPRVTHTGTYIHAGPEIGVASTKAFTGQVTVLSMMAIEIAYLRGTIRRSYYYQLLHALEEIPSKIEKTLELNSKIKYIAQEIASASNCLYLGRGYNFPTALEGALKLKEISYIHAEGYPAAEMKHGPIALIDENMPVIVIATNISAHEKIVSNIQEVKARKGIVIAIVTEGDTIIRDIADYTIEIPEVIEPLSPLVSVIPLQLLSYHIALMRGCNVDQPRNLAKSVTVE
jgi:glucosamine--fructose-6-phosphate aminotransferase (isomerizing)